MVAISNADDVINADLIYMLDNLSEELENLNNQNLLITGGAGFLGYYLIKLILFRNVKYPKLKINLTVMDNFIRGTPKWISELANNNLFKLIEHDITSPFPSNVDNFNYIIHAASIASPTFYRLFPIETMDSNVIGLRNLLNYSASVSQNPKKQIKGFLFFSTSEIYGDPDIHNIPTTENYRGNVSCTGPRACYDESKRYGETLCVNFANKYNLPIKIARPFNNYGPGLKITDKRVIPDFAKNIFLKENIEMLSNGNPSRTFCYITDAIIGYYKILVKGNLGEAYNIGIENPEITMTQLAEKITKISSDLFSYKGKIIYKDSSDKDYLIDNPNRRCPDIKKAKKDLNYNPQISLDEGLKRILLWYRENLILEDS